MRSGSGWRDLSVALNNLGDFYLRRGGHGDADRALEAYEQSLATRQRIAEQNPDDAQAARDLVVSHYKLAETASAASRADDQMRHLAECHRVLARMSSAGMTLDPPSQQLLQELERTFG